MKKIILITPVYNDWESFNKLLNEISLTVENLHNVAFQLIVINDGSTMLTPKINIPKNIKKIEILNMKKNNGHAICLAHGIRYCLKNYEFDYIILMDADGEDRPVEILDLIFKIDKDPKTSIVAKRVKRSEGPIFRVFYQCHKILTFIFTGKLMNFGNYSILTKKDAEILSIDRTLNSNISGTVKKNIKNLGYINCVRGKRYFGPSKMPLTKLIFHSFSIIAVFKMNVFLRSALFIILFSYLNPYIGIYGQVLSIVIVFFNLMIYYVSLMIEKNKKINTEQEQKNSEIIVH